MNYKWGIAYVGKEILNKEVENKISTPLFVNAAACSGVLSECSSIRKNGFDGEDFQAEFLLNIGNWALECLGARGNENVFWDRWDRAEEILHEIPDLELGDLGFLCRVAPDLLKKKEFTSIADQNIIAMYRCYENSLLAPRGINLDDIDSHLDDKTEDLRLSEMVFEKHFKGPLISRVDQWINEREGEIVVADIGAGNGRVLEEVASFLSAHGRAFRLIAVDPSPIAREECKLRLNSLGTNPTQIVNGTIEEARDGKIKELSNDLIDKNLLILMKGVVHDRTIDIAPIKDDASRSNSEAIYRNINWSPISCELVVADLTKFLDHWKQTKKEATIFMMESHLIDSQLINQLIGTVPLLPAYIGHALTAQYLITCPQHHRALLRSEMALKTFDELVPVGQGHAIMSLAQLQ